MTGPCFVDANVFVYAQDARDPRKHRRVEEWLDELWRTRLGRTSAQALSEFYSVATRKLKIAPGVAWEEAERYFCFACCRSSFLIFWLCVRLRRSRAVCLRA
jgi:predicted nucleic acid-binding protein